ncbi:Bax inhibitor-1/YccA family protein [Levilactobacillus spicheri]|uniref:Membrane protein n=2 Tax=Levilactobacillus spicheri TaxID=216463 RepID=A0A0F3RU39_9LACO|nr:Bax inhibitor-1/YccA family protein [Levilactobacillus spicheri]KJW13548.1 membrane protein [Levilactobacillus spicheri]KRL46448.1 integral membrane protein, interacts with FtsH [Levilactobacillus spicheri DSM 15429]GEO66335.1 membrane protein [Levilactobacillus spicheri]
MNNFQQQPRETINTQVGLNSFLTKMFGWMGLAVLVSAATAYYMVASGSAYAMRGSSMLIGLIVWFILPFVISAQSMKRPTVAFGGLMVYAVITGAVISTYALIYTQTAMAQAFVSSAAVFITMAVIGMTTKRDLSKVGTQATAALIGLIVAMVINIFMKSTLLALIFSFVAVIIFAALTAWDTQKMQKMYLQYGDQVSTTGLAVTGALQLYLDFVNLFLQILQIIGIFGGGNRD